MTDLPETTRRWDAYAQEWTVTTVMVAPQARPARPSRVRASRPIAYVPQTWPVASDTSPISDTWRYTAFAPGEPLADLRTWIKPTAMKTGRAATPLPADPGRITETGRRS